MKSLKKFLKQSMANKAYVLIVGIALAIFSASLLIPILWTVNASLLSTYQFLKEPFSFPKEIMFSNYITAFKNLSVEVWRPEKQVTIRYNIFNMLLNSFGYSSIYAFMGVFVPSLAAYILAKYKFVGRAFLFQLAIFIMIIPVLGSLPSELRVRRALGLYDNFFGFLLTAQSAFSFNFLLLYGAFRGLPNAYREAARIDGAGHYTIMFRIYYRLMMPLMLALFFLGFIGSWNDYMTIIIWLPSTPNLAYGVYLYQQNASIMGYSLPEILAGFLIVAVPTVLIWVAVQGLVTKRLAVGGLKG